MGWPEVPQPEVSIKVTNINGRYHCRLFLPDGTIQDEAACEDKRDIQYTCRDLLRWHDKMGDRTQYTDRARHRNKPGSSADGCHGRIWNQREILEERVSLLKTRMTPEQAVTLLDSNDPAKAEAAAYILKED